jgi:hypothetical protein
VEEYNRHFRPIEGQVGAVFLINGRVVGLDSFGKPDTLARVFKKLVQSYALDAIDFLDRTHEGGYWKRPGGSWNTYKIPAGPYTLSFRRKGMV